ncbi:hypothetical protein ACFPRL_08325 [Pseudoclavibacter helvolus]
MVLADLLDDATVALGARVGDDDAVVGCPDLSKALQTNFDSHVSPDGVCIGERQPEGVGHTRQSSMVNRGPD